MMVRRRWRGREGIRMIEIVEDILVVEEGMMVKFPLPWSILPLVTVTCSSSFKVLSNKKKFNNHIVEIHKDPTLWIIWWFLRHQITCH